jgi:hypothetical protein
MSAVAGSAAPRLSTAPEPVDLRRLRRERTMRRVAIGFLVAFAILGASSLLGPRTSVVRAAAEGYTMVVTYPSVTRPGLPIRWEIEVVHPGGFDGKILLSTTFDYLHLFDISNLEPEPSGSTSSGDQIIYAFNPPPGDTFRVSMDGNTEPGVHELPQVVTSLVVDGRTVVQVTYATRVMP